MTHASTQILIVEDDPAHAALIRRAFEAKEQEVNLNIASNLQQAKTYLANNTPNLVITDLRLPDGQGTELLPPDMENNLYPVVIMTSHGDEKVAVEAMRAGALDYVVKSEITLLDTPHIAQRALREWKHIVKRRQAEDELRKLYLAVEQSPVSVVITNIQGNIEYVNPKFTKTTGYTFEEAVGQNPRILKTGHTSPDDYKNLWETITSGKEWHGEFQNKKKNGETYWELARISPIRNKAGEITHFVAVKEDITKRKQAEAEREQLEAQLRQSQKMESVGRLAAGIAHDFNNLLLVINGFAELLQIEISPNNPQYEIVEKILHSGQRAADLVRQLLAFSRKQIIKPQVINLDDTIINIDKMLRRLIGENIELQTILAPDLWLVKADPNQIEQIIINLAINARDAMPNGGKLTIETSNITLDDEYVTHHLGTTPGRHVLLTISDTGHGMSEDMKNHIFEPFFTTKEVGQGTGLGLATVFGIVKQNAGNIWVYSEETIGTTFKVYLPAIDQMVAQSSDQSSTKKLPPGHETILLVEDDPAVRHLAKTVLERQGYTVLEAQNGQTALHIASGYNDTIHLLLTDVVMPDINGKELADELTIINPHLKTLFMSGYTNNAIENHGILSPNIDFLQKPFGPQKLTQKVRIVLDS